MITMPLRPVQEINIIFPARKIVWTVRHLLCILTYLISDIFYFLPHCGSIRL